MALQKYKKVLGTHNIFEWIVRWSCDQVSTSGFHQKQKKLYYWIKLRIPTSNPLSSSPVRIPGFHPGDPGSNPGNGTLFKFVFLPVFFLS